MPNSSELKKIILRRGQVKAELTRFETFLNNFDQNITAYAQVETRLETIKACLFDFKNIQLELEETIINENGTLDQEKCNQDRGDFESKYYDVITRAKEILSNRPVDQTAARIMMPPSPILQFPTNIASSSNVTARLPSLRLPEFSGAYSDWQRFYDTFEALVHNNVSLANIEKFYYLQTSLKGEAAHVIAALSISDANYAIAWDLLKSRYENQKAIINAHIREIFELPTLNRESHVSLRKLLDTFFKNYRSLEALGESVKTWDTMLIYVLISKLDFHSKREWENFSKDITHPKIDDFTKHLTQRCQMLETLDSKNAVSFPKKLHDLKTFASTTNPTCPLCKENHFIYFCKKFKDLSVTSRLEQVKRLGLCTNCLRYGHKTIDCKSGSCKICNKKHSSLLHRNNTNQNNSNTNNHETQTSTTRNATTQNANVQRPNDNNASSQFQEPFPQVLSHYSQPSSEHLILLSTAVVNVYDSSQLPIKCRVLLDSGSQSNFVTKNLANKLNLELTKINIPVAGINQIKTNISHQGKISLKSIHNNYTANLSFLVIDKITDFIPQQSFDVAKLNIPEDLKLADPQFNVASPVDMLLGATIFYELLRIGQIRLGKNLPILQETVLGWILSGHVPNFNNNQSSKCFLTNLDLNNQMEKFWRLEELHSNPTEILTQEEAECEQHFKKNVTRDETGHFIVKLPLKQNVSELGKSEESALQRLYSIERKLARSPEIAHAYKNFMSEYESLNHMVQINPDLNKDNDIPICYLPHHCVEKPDSTTTKVRVVFDASAKTSSNLSLNDVLKVGATIQNDLFAILLSFRKHNVVLIGDLTKMYRQILIHPEQRNLQRIVWRANPNEEVKHFQLKTVTYGTASASFLATRCLKEIAIENENTYPVECDIISNHFYVDDLLTGAKDVETMLTIKHNLTKLLSDYGFELRKFQSNDSNLLKEIGKQQVSSQYLITDDNSVKTLGISWVPSVDSFEYNVQNTCQTICKQTTKRSVLSFIARIFDPLGLLGPIVIVAKILIQQLWLQKVAWDEPLTDTLNVQWLEFINGFSHINHIRVPRHALVKNATTIQIHGFSDASEKAYGCAVYLRSSNGDEIECNLLCAKSRVAPLKSVSLPRLELCGALLLSRLIKKCVTALNLELGSIFLWTDSTIVLSWISREPKTWKTFISNRVSEIQQNTCISDWNYVNSQHNPADVLSRGIDPLKLAKLDIWWHGPSYLLDNSDFWPKNTHIVNYSRSPAEVLEFRKQTVSLASQTSSPLDIFEKYSSLNRLTRVFAYCLRFRDNLKNPNFKTVGQLTSSEITNSLKTLIKIVQREGFEKDLISLQKNKTVDPKSKLNSLCPFVDENGLIRVGGRLKHSSLTYDQKHQILLPEKHSFTQLVIRYEHERSLHSGIQTTLSHIRQTYWPLNGKQLVKAYIRRCIPCFRANPKISLQKMGELPSQRVIPSRPFAATGVDYAGPFDLKDGKTRNKKIIKGYICIFVCLATKAVHLELVSDLTSDGFLSMLKRFVSRRGFCTDIFSDNATNFVGSQRELKQNIQNLINTDRFQNYISQSRINWHFIPARSPHHGGLWEASVKSVKYHLKRILCNIPLTYEEFYTLLTQIEATLNSRPLLPLTSDPNDLEILTPAHFLIGQELTALPQQDLRTSTINHLKRYRHLQQLAQHFWTRWSKEYLHNLQQRTKWRFSKPPYAKVGSLVLLKDENLPPFHWPLGRIVELHPGADGEIRVVTVKTKTSLVKRAIVKVCLLPSDEN